MTDEDGFRTLPASAVPVGAVLHLAPDDVTVARISRADPVPGRLLIIDSAGRAWSFGGAAKVRVVSLP